MKKKKKKILHHRSASSHLVVFFLLFFRFSMPRDVFFFYTRSTHFASTLRLETLLQSSVLWVVCSFFFRVLFSLSLKWKWRISCLSPTSARGAARNWLGSSKKMFLISRSNKWMISIHDEPPPPSWVRCDCVVDDDFSLFIIHFVCDVVVDDFSYTCWVFFLISSRMCLSSSRHRRSWMNDFCALCLNG